jgi:hypothetical protein
MLPWVRPVRCWWRPHLGSTCIRRNRRGHAPSGCGRSSRTPRWRYTSEPGGPWERGRYAVIRSLPSTSPTCRYSSGKATPRLISLTWAPS